MSAAEISSIAFGLFLGYWIVSKLFTSGSKPSGEKPRNESRKDSREEAKSSASQERPRATEPQWYEVLKVNESASAEEIQAAYKSLIRQYHPDKVSTLGEELRQLAEEKSKAINVAYQTGMRSRGL